MTSPTVFCVEPDHALIEESFYLVVAEIGGERRVVTKTASWDAAVRDCRALRRGERPPGMADFAYEEYAASLFEAAS